MKIVKLSDLSAEERTRVLEQQEIRKKKMKQGLLSENDLTSKIDDNKSTISEEEENTWFKKGAFDDGYQFGDLTKTTLSSVGDVGLNVVKGIGSIGEGIGDAIWYGVAEAEDLLGKSEDAEITRKIARENTLDSIFEPAQSALDKNSVFGNKSDNIVQGLGYVAGITAVSVLSAGAGAAAGLSTTASATIGTTAVTFTNGMSNGMTEALNNGSSIEEARIYGAISGAGESLSELMFGGLGKASKAVGLSKGIGELDDVVIGGLTKNIKNKMTKTLIQSGLKATGEGLEEVISGLISAAGKKLTYMDEKKYSEIIKDENLAEQFWMGALTSAIAQGPSTIRSIKTGTDYISGRTNNEQKVYDNEISTRTKEKIRELTIEQAYNEQIKTQENLGINITDEVKSEIMKKVENSYDNGKLEDIKLSNKELSKIEEKVQKDMEDGNISFENIMNILGENQDISKDNLLMRSKYENEQRYNSYQFEATDNEKVNILMQSAADAGMNNTSKTRKRVELISKLVKDTDRQYKFVSQEQLKKLGYNENANGLIDKSTGEILINVHNDKGIQTIVGHETTHIFDSKNKNGEYSKEYQNLQNIAIEYAKTKGIYDSKIKSITEAYGDLLLNESQIKEELTADLVGDFLFNDTKFIENLAVKDRNIFQKIYDYIKHVYKVVTAGTEEAKALENLKYQFEKVYKTISEETNNDTKYSIAGKKAIENIKGTKFYQEAEENLKLAKQLKKEGENNLTLIKKTGWFQDQAGDWKFEFSDKNMELKKINFSLNKEYNLLEVLEHGELFYFYPELANYTIIFKNKSNSSYSAKDRTISLAYEKIGDSEKLKGTLIHEIQHAIQHIENHAHGTTAKLGLMRYYNTLGEIEAADTKERYLNTVEGKRNTILPETAKKNPTHPKIKNGDILYKITNGVYNFFHGGEKNVYKNKNSLEQNFERNKTLVDERGRIKYSLKEPENKSGSFNLPKIEEGYTRLYRGLENEYNPNYDRTLLDNNNGYESWTDDYDLAKAYGDNVYYIDVPTIDITDSIIDEDANSETYGDRNLIYRNNKPVGIKGKSGNEYMLYTDHENYSAIQYNKIDNSQSIKDNQGRRLTKEQQEFFKDSKVKDENGNLITVYHGTTKAGFTEFSGGNRGVNYYTDNKNVAQSYIDLYRSSHETNKKNGVYEGYANITNPLEIDVQNRKWSEIRRDFISDIDILELIDVDLERKYNIFSTTDVVIAAKKSGKYDGVIFKNIYDNATSTKKDLSTVYATFNSNQFKNVDNLNPTDNPDIRLSMTNDTRITGDDIAIREMLKEERNTIEDEVGNITTNVPTVEEVITQTEDEKQQRMKEKARKYLSRSKTKFMNKVVEDFGTSKIANTKVLNSVVDQIRNDIEQNGPLTKEKINKYFDELYNNLVVIDTVYYDTYKELKDNIRSTKLYISETVKKDLADRYNDFRKNNMRTLLMTNDSNNVPIDTYYQELSDLYPELFSDEIINPTDQLERISEVAKDISKVERNVAAYNDKYMGKDYRDWARASFDKNISDFTNDIKLADRYNTATNSNPKLGVDKELIKAAYKQLPVVKKVYEKAISKELLTKEDRIQVDRILNNEISIQEIPNDLNKEGIIKVATAKQEYDMLQKSIKEYQSDIKKKRLEEAEQSVGDLNRWKDKNIGFKYSRETPIRNIYDIAPKDIADNVVNKYFRSYIEVNEKKVVDAINSYNERIEDLEIGTKNKYKVTYQDILPGETNEISVTKNVSESGLIQLLGEKKISIEDIKNAGADVVKIENAVKEFRNIYNELISQINESMLDNGYAPVEYRKDYFPHFTEEETDTLLGKAAKILGIDIKNREELPTDIAGQTYNFKPGRTWFSNILQRTTDVTDYDVLKGFDKYVRGATDLIYHTGDIQNLRALSTVIRGAYNDTEIKNRVEEINESTTMSDLEKSTAIQEIYNLAKDRSHLSKFIEWLDNYTNLLTGKKAINDRPGEKELNRQMYQTMVDVEGRIASNAIGGNIGVSLTNFTPISTAWGEIKTTNLINGIWQTMKASVKKDKSFASESEFITRRRGTDRLSKTTLEKITSPINNFLQFSDNFSSEVIVRSRYNQNLQEGMSRELALEEANRYTAGLMGDRGRGALPTQFSNKNPISKMINMFQVEVNNQWSYYLKDLPKNMQEKANNNKAKIISNVATAYSKIMVGAYLVNELLGTIRGNSTRVLPDPIYIIKELINGLTDDDDENDDDTVIETITEVVGNVPFISIPATLLSDSLGLEVGDIGRIPISGAIPNVSEITSDIFDVVNGEKTLGDGIKDISEELLDTVGASLLLPYGGSQIKKTIKGLDMFSSDKPVAGSYTDKGDLRYTVEEDVGSKVQAALFGAYANPYSQDYIDSGFKTIKKDNIDEMVGLDMNSTEYREFKKNLSKVSNTSDKNGYKQYKDENDNTYWYDANSEIMYDDKYKKTTLTEDDLIKVSKKEESLNYINSLDLTDSQKNLVANNLNKNSKKKIDMSEYDNYSSYEEYTYARDYPKKYSVISKIDTYDKYQDYQDDISEIKKEYSTELGYTSKERKAAVQSYINSLDIDMYQKMMLEKMAGGYSIKNYQKYIYEYLESMDLTNNEKYTIWEELFN